MRNLKLFNDSAIHPWRGLMDMQRNLDRMFDQAFGERSDRWSDETVFYPACEVEESDSHYLMSIDLPGVSKKDISIEARDNQLIVSGERKSEKKERGFSERVCGKFQRVISLPNGVDAEKIEASYEDGVLNVALPKAEFAKPRQIKINDGKGSLFGRLVEGTKAGEKQAKPSSAASAA